MEKSARKSLHSELIEWLCDSAQAPSFSLHACLLVLNQADQSGLGSESVGLWHRTVPLHQLL
jgi:hypothetical protein